ncbi:MAG: ABC transporter ATP-binding protein [Candidatus Paceibacterota bacterium]
MFLIEAKNLEMVYEDGDTKTVALKNVDFSAKKGEFVAIMGPSGSGKSTLLHVLGFLDRNTSGEYRFDGKLIDELNDEELAQTRNKKMGFVFQAFNLLSRTSVLENVKLPLLYAKKSDAEAEKIATKAIEGVGLLHRINHEPSELSGGEKQRVAIARALVNDPLVIFADEPTGNLDSKSGENIMDILYDLSEKGKTVVLITHERQTAEYADRIIHLKDGEMEKEEKLPRGKGARGGGIK